MGTPLPFTHISVTLGCIVHLCGVRTMLTPREILDRCAPWSAGSDRQTTPPHCPLGRHPKVRNSPPGTAHPRRAGDRTHTSLMYPTGRGCASRRRARTSDCWFFSRDDGWSVHLGWSDQSTGHVRPGGDHRSPVLAAGAGSRSRLRGPAGSSPLVTVAAPHSMSVTTPSASMTQLPVSTPKTCLSSSHFQDICCSIWLGRRSQTGWWSQPSTRIISLSAPGIAR